MRDADDSFSPPAGSATPLTLMLASTRSCHNVGSHRRFQMFPDAVRRVLTQQFRYCHRLWAVSGLVLPIISRAGNRAGGRALGDSRVERSHRVVAACSRVVYPRSEGITTEGEKGDLVGGPGQE